MTNWTRREVLAAGGALALGPIASIADESMLTRPIPASGEALPVIGLGTYSVFDAAASPDEIALRRRIVDLLTGKGASLIDTSPMYNRSERMIGDVIADGAARDHLFLATKVWIDGKDAGITQMQKSADLMKTDVIDLMQVHNLRDTAAHMATIRDWQEADRIRYSGLTHYRAASQAALGRAMQAEKPDFIQINYSLGEREADVQLLPQAADQGVAVIINRPYQAGALFSAVRGQEVPDWAQEFAASWGQFFLKFIISHPAVTCVIPATSKTHHMEDNLQAGFGPLPDDKTRQRMVDFIKSV